MSRIVAFMVAGLLFIAGGVPLFGGMPNTAGAQGAIYDPRTVAAALLNSPPTEAELGFAEPAEQVSPSSPGALYEVQIHWGFGLLYYLVYPDGADAATVIGMGLEVPLDEVPGQSAWITAIDNGYGGCAVEANVRVCAVSNYSVSNYPDGAVIMAVEGGLQHLRRVAGSPSQSAAQQTDARTTITQHPASNSSDSHSQTGLYDPTMTVSALLDARFTDDELLWAGAPKRVKPSSPEALDEVEFRLTDGLLSFAFYATADDADMTGLGELEFPLEDVPGASIWMNDDASGAGGCASDANVRVCAVSTYGVSPAPGGAVIIAVREGLKLLHRVAAPTGRASQGVQAAPQGSGAVPQSASFYLPRSLGLAQETCFETVDGGTIDFASLTQRMADVPNGANQLAALGWQDGAFVQLGCDYPPAGSAGWIEVGVHTFGDAASAAAALSIFAEARVAGTLLGYVSTPNIGNSIVGISGPAGNGTEVTYYAAEGPLLVRVTGVAPVGLPTADVEAVLEQVLAAAG